MGKNIVYVNFHAECDVGNCYTSTQDLLHYIKDQFNDIDKCNLSDIDYVYIQLCKECIELRDKKAFSTLTAQEYCHLIAYICTI